MAFGFYKGGAYDRTIPPWYKQNQADADARACAALVLAMDKGRDGDAMRELSDPKVARAFGRLTAYYEREEGKR